MNTNNNTNNKQTLYPTLDGFGWGDRPFKEDFIYTNDRKSPVLFDYENRCWDIRYEHNSYCLYMENELYSNHIYLTQGVYKCNFLSFRQGAEFEFDRNWKSLSVTYYTKKNNKEEFVSKFIIEY